MTFESWLNERFHGTLPPYEATKLAKEAWDAKERDQDAAMRDLVAENYALKNENDSLRAQCKATEKAWRKSMERLKGGGE